ncbi:hypothetical protein HUJ05_002345 [Dendroctonus ponderosae]|nr:hypothetical protein HUJ05_002345 [Dendroctonus ponderosae]
MSDNTSLGLPEDDDESIKEIYTMVPTNNKLSVKSIEASALKYVSVVSFIPIISYPLRYNPFLIPISLVHRTHSFKFTEVLGSRPQAL